VSKEETTSHILNNFGAQFISPSVYHTTIISHWSNYCILFKV